MNQKGGVGKTTTTVNLAAALAEAGKTVCVIDMDPQSHATLHFGVEELPNEEFKSLYDVLVEGTPIAEVRRRIDDKISLIPAHLDLTSAEMQLVGTVAREQILKNKLLEDKPDYDYLLIDCPPALGVLTINALTAVDEVFIPLEPHFLALQGLGKLLLTIEVVVKQLNKQLRLGGVVLCKYEGGTKLAGEVADEVETYLQNIAGKNNTWSKAKLFKTRVRKNIALAEAPSHGVPILQYAPTSNGADDYRSLAQEVLNETGV
jgi:chromosome partitioning protein